MTQDKVLYVHQFAARKKDNPELDHDVRKTFVSDKLTQPKEFEVFCQKYQGFTCRYYRALNGRRESKVKRDLVAHMVLHPDFNLAQLNGLARRFTANSGVDTDTRRWLFDFDSNDEVYFQQFVKDLTENYYQGDYQVYPTLNGFHLVTEKGFYKVEDFVAKYQDVLEFKRTDAMVLVEYRLNSQPRKRSEYHD